jgi:methionyl-tRNA formyltransferase
MSSSPLRVAFFGLPLAALALQRAGISPQVVALGHPAAPGARRVRRELGPRALLLAKPDLTRPEVVRALRAARPDVLLSWFWPWRIPESVLALAPRGAFGVHPSLLPRWRGPDPYFWSLLQGDSHTGVSLHRLAADYDTGDVIAQRRLAIAPSWNAWHLAKALDALGLPLLVEAARQLAAGDPLSGWPQDEGASSAAPRPDDELTELHWREPVEALLRRVRALAPYPGASAWLDDEQVDVLAAERYPGNVPAALAPGDAVASAAGVVVRAGQGAMLLGKVRCADGELLRGPAIARLFPHGLSRI